MTVHYTLRPAAESDHDMLVSLIEITLREYVEQIWGWNDERHRALFRENWNVDDWRIVLVDGEVAGALSVRVGAESLHVRDILLLPAFQGQGMGTALMRLAIAEARDLGLPVTLNVFHLNVGAKQLYDRLGFRVVEADDHKYTMRLDPGLDFSDARQ